MYTYCIFASCFSFVPSG